MPYRALNTNPLSEQLPFILIFKLSQPSVGWVCPAARLAEEEEEADLQPPGCSNELGLINEAATERGLLPQPSVAASAGGGEGSSPPPDTQLPDAHLPGGRTRPLEGGLWCVRCLEKTFLLAWLCPRRAPSPSQGDPFMHIGIKRAESGIN